MRRIRVRPVFVVRRIQKRVVTDVQRIRVKLLNDLEKLFDMATRCAQESTEAATAEEKAVKRALREPGTGKETEKLTPKQRQTWARIAAYTAQVMNSLTKSFDESQITEDLKRLEKMVNEAMAKEKGRRSPAAS